MIHVAGWIFDFEQNVNLSESGRFVKAKFVFFKGHGTGTGSVTNLDVWREEFREFGSFVDAVMRGSKLELRRIVAIWRAKGERKAIFPADCKKAL